MPLGTEVGLGPRHIVLDGNPAPAPERGTAAPLLFDPCLLWPNGRPSQQLLSSCYHVLSCSRHQHQTGGQSNLVTGRIAAAHGRFSGIRQVAPVCTLA